MCAGNRPNLYTVQRVDRDLEMPPKPRWLLAIPDAISQLEKLDRTLLTRRDIERLFGVSTARAATLMQTFGAEMTGYQRTLPRTKLLRQLRKHRARSAFRGEVERLLISRTSGPTEKLTVTTDSGGLHFDLHSKVVQTAEEALGNRGACRGFARYRPPRSW